MNRFKKYCPNVWVAETKETYKKGDEIILRHCEARSPIVFSDWVVHTKPLKTVLFLSSVEK